MHSDSGRLNDRGMSPRISPGTTYSKTLADFHLEDSRGYTDTIERSIGYVEVLKDWEVVSAPYITTI